MSPNKQSPVLQDGDICLTNGGACYSTFIERGSDTMAILLSIPLKLKENTPFE